MVRKVGVDKKQVLHRMTLGPFTPTQDIPDVQATPQDWKSDSEVIIKHDDLYARAWEFEYEKPVFDDMPSSLTITLRSDLLMTERVAFSATHQKTYQESYPRANMIPE